MKRISVLLFGLFAAGQVFAAVTATCISQSTSHSGVVIAGSTNFVKTDFLPKCSANVDVKYDQTTIGFAVAGASTKGKQIYSGNTGGGGISPVGTCTGTNSACAASQLDTPVTNALALAT
jgi:hypothetical protein